MLVDKKEIKEVCKNYGIEKIKSVQSLSDGYANLNFKIETEKGNFLYRVCTQQSNIKNIFYEIDLLQELKKINFPAAYMIPRIDGNFITDSKSGRVLIYEFKEGSEPELNQRTITQIAGALGKLNTYNDWENFPKKNIINIDNCNQLIDQFKNLCRLLFL